MWFFASALANKFGLFARVIDLDQESINSAREKGVQAVCADAVNPPIERDETVVCFNLILHHLVAAGDAETLALQSQAIKAWQSSGALIFVNEYIYEPYFQGLSGWLIFQITSSAFLSKIRGLVSKLLPSLRANTFNVGVRFRSNKEWQHVFEECGFKVIRMIKGEPENVAAPRRLLLIKEIRRDSFLLAQ